MEMSIKIDYREYPECMFAVIAAFLPEKDGHELRRIAGKVGFRSEDVNGNTYRNGVLHSFDDNPAYSTKHQIMWYKNGKIHREGDKPAIISRYSNQWSKNGKRHREGGLPAVEETILERKEWWVDGKLHREGDFPAVIYQDQRLWYKNGKLHREGDFPAIIRRGEQIWLKDNKRHRENLPALINEVFGVEEWWVDGKFILKESRVDN